MVLTSPSVLVLEWTLKNGWRQYLCHLSKSQLPPPLPGALQDQHGGLTQAPFKLHLPLVSEHVRFCVCPLRIQSVSHIHVALLKVIPTGSQGLIFLVQSPGPGGSVRTQTRHSLRRTSAVITILQFLGCLPGSMGLDYTVSLPLLLISLWFLYIFSCGRSFLPVFPHRSFSLIVAL